MAAQPRTLAADGKPAVKRGAAVAAKVLGPAHPEAEEALLEISRR